MTEYTTTSDDLLNFVIKQALGETDQATMVLKNTDNEYSGLTPYTIFDIAYGSAPLFSGRIDKPTPAVSMKPDTKTQVIEVIGRNHARNLFGIAIDENFEYQEALDIVESMIGECPLITYTAGSSGVDMSIPAKLGYVGGYLQYILNERLGRDYYVDTDGLLNEFAIGTLATGITLSLAKNGNILDFIWDKNDITEVENYIILKGGKLDDHWSEGNASDWATNATSVTDESVLVSMGVQSLKCTIGAVSDPYIELDIYNGGNGLYSYDSLDFSGIVNGELNFDVLLSSDPDITLFGQIYVSLFDDSGSVINHTYGSNMLENLYGNFCGVSLPIGPGTTITLSSLQAHGEWWYSVSGGSEFTWNIRKIRIGLVGWDSISRPDTFIIDNLSMPVLVRSVEQDTNSQTNYGLVMHPEDVNLGSQVEMDASAVATLAEKKDPIKLATILAIGTAGIDGSTNNWKIGGTFTLNNTLEGITAEAWRILSMIHRYDPNNPVDGHSYVVELTAVPNAQKTGINRLQSLNNNSYFLKELRTQIASLEQREAINTARPPALPGSLSDLYLFDDTMMMDRWYFSKLPFTLETGTTKESDSDAAKGYVLERKSTEGSASMWDCDDVYLPDSASGKVYFYCRMKVASIASASSVLTITIVQDSNILKTVNIPPGYFDTNDKFKTFGFAVNMSADYPFQIEGSFITGVTDIQLDWIGASSFAIPSDTSGVSVNAETLALDVTVSTLALDVTNSTLALDITSKDIPIAIQSENAHAHGLSNVGAHIPITIDTNCYVATTSGGSPTKLVTCISTYSSVYVVTGTATGISSSPHTHTMDDDGHIHTQDNDDHLHTQDNDNHGHSQGDEDHDHTLEDGEDGNGHEHDGDYPLV